MTVAAQRVFRVEMQLFLGAIALMLAMATPAAGESFPPEPEEGGEDPSSGLVLASGDADDNRVPGHYIVVFEDSVDRPGNVARAQIRQRGGKLGFVYNLVLSGYSASDLSREDVEALRRDPRVKYVVPDQVGSIAEQTIPTGIERINATENPTLDIDEVNDVQIDADVAVLDTGVDFEHPDLEVVQRTNCVPAGEDPYSEGSLKECVDDQGTDGHGHGTHVAGTIGAVDNAEGVVGIAPGARIWAVRTNNNEGWVALAWLIAGIEWVTDHASEIEVANMSIEGFGVQAPLDEALAKSVEKGVIYVAAAGNHRRNTASEYPGGSPHVIAVSALTDYDGQPQAEGSKTCTNWGPDDTLANFSNWGEAVEIAAPGVCIYSTLPDGKYGFKSGTSMASPHVAGAAAILASESKPKSAEGVEAITQSLIHDGTVDWTDTSEDDEAEPLLYLGAESPTELEVSTGGVSSSDGQVAVFTGAVNTRGHEAEYEFEYGPTTGYGQTIEASENGESSGDYSTVVSVSTEALPAQQLIHYRLVASVGGKAIYGQDRTFTPSYWEISQPVSEPESSGNAWLNDVSCPTAGFCMAVGLYNGEELLASYERVNKEWTWHSVPVPYGGTYARLEGISCLAPDTCMAVGRIYGSGGYTPMAARWNGTSWSSETVPAPAGASAPNFRSVSCASETDCVAVGYFKNDAGVWVDYSAQWSQEVWTNLSTPNPAGATTGELVDVSCASASFCTAVGWHGPEGGGVDPTIVTWNGTSWSLGAPARSSGSLHGVSCVSSEFCAAVGPGPSSEMWDGSEWLSESAANLPGASGGYLEDVSCTSEKYCTAVGASLKGPRYFALAEVWGGTSWATEAMPWESEARDELWSVACVPLAGCAAVGGARSDGWISRISFRDDVSTEAPSEIGFTEVTLNGTVNPSGAATTYQFEYGTTTEYGSKAPASPESVGSGHEAVVKNETISGLSPETTYHFRVVAQNSEGTTYGNDRAFTTPAIAPTSLYEFGSQGSGNGQFQWPRGIAVDSSGQVWVSDQSLHRVQKFSEKGEYLAQFGTEGSGNGQFDSPRGIAVTSSGDLCVVDSGNDRIQRFNSKGEYLGKFGTSGSGNGQFSNPWDIAIAPDESIWVTDIGNDNLQKLVLLAFPWVEKRLI